MTAEKFRSSFLLFSAARQVPRHRLSRSSHMESWKKVWCDCVVPLLNVDHLRALETALATDDPRLMQGGTTEPPPLQAVQDWPCEAACALGYCGWIGDGLETVAEVAEFFARMCFEIDRNLGEPAACRWFLNAYDEWSREEMRAALLPEVRAALAAKETLA
jgi:hypothetical protein